MLVEPLDPADVKGIILAAINSGKVSFSKHALEELAKDNKTTVDAINVIRGGVVRHGEHEKWIVALPD